MAYSCVQVLFEIGHEAVIRTKRSPKGFTHDWEVFVRGADNTDINHFVDKVVFHLHETFPKPKRVVKDPPYSVKETGYAGFNLPIDICFRTGDEPKKVRFNYDLDLQPTKVQRETYVFRNPDEDLRRRLICGGGVGVGSDSAVSSHLTPGEKPRSSPAIAASADEAPSAKPLVPPLVGKPKLGGDPTKKLKIKEYRSEESRASSSFHELFGTPIKTTKASPDPKKPSPSPKVSPSPKPVKPPDKPSSDKQVSGTKPVKHSVQKDSQEKTGSSSKEEKKDRNKDRDKNKEKAKHPATPPKRPPSPPKCPPSKPTKDDPKKVQVEEPKSKSDSKSLGDSSKSEKKKKDKKSKDEKSKKERHKDHESKSCEKVEKVEKPQSKDKEKEAARKPEKESNKETDKHKEREKLSSDGNKERARHKHKKKERSQRDETGKERDRGKEKGVKKSSSDKKTVETKDRDKNGVTSDANKKRSRSHSHSPHPTSSPTKPSPSSEKLVHPIAVKDKPVKRPLTKLFDELKDHESSDSNLSPDEDSIELPVPQVSKLSAPVQNSGKLETAPRPDVPNKSVVNTSNNSHSNSRQATKSKPESANQERNSLPKVSSSKQKHKSASKKSKEKKGSSGSSGKDESGRRADKDVGKKRKHKSSGKVKEEESGGGGKEDGAPAQKLLKLDPELSRTNDPVEWISTEVSVQAEVSTTTASADEVHPVEMFDTPVVAPAATTAGSPAQFSPDYVSQLKDLQRKIMTLEDNAELQRVVQVIAETGQYEITKKTFDFDLCALDRSTVKRLQDFFTTS
ncbi:protein AF-9 isoform X2 [Zootermopsis nevadensis]|uniref:Protein AF-9 n=1 Tax=Zootermopsis nevadensis TaxID=136037 RepID=A0A067RGQ7_ZOONE|nr:protein AF-9 isoform X2 [Zootermopsis nevadensis]KDR18313.1 Protein AF-9 [Zootermopsis nevadensis]